MLDTDPLYGLMQLFAYLDGLNSPTEEPGELAKIALEHLTASGFVLRHSKFLPLSRSATSEDIRATRKALRVTNHRLAMEAGLSTTVVVAAQKSGAAVRPQTMQALIEALVRLGAKLEENSVPSDVKAQWGLPP